MRLAGCVLLCLVATGCGSDLARVKGRVVDGAMPFRVEAGTQVSLRLSAIGVDGTPDPTKFYTAVLEAEGAFEVLASGGALTPGTYQVSLDAFGSGVTKELKSKLKPFASAGSKLRVRLTAGPNDITVDLAKPEG